jgi:hypothetical protein
MFEKTHQSPTVASHPVPTWQHGHNTLAIYLLRILIMYGEARGTGLELAYSAPVGLFGSSGIGWLFQEVIQDKNNGKQEVA